MIDMSYIKSQMREIYNQHKKNIGFKGTSRLDDILYNKTNFFKVIENEKVIANSLNIQEMEHNFKENLNTDKYEILKSNTENFNKIIYMRVMNYNNTKLYGGIIVIQLKDNSLKLSVFQHNTLVKALDPDKEISYFTQLINGMSRENKESFTFKNTEITTLNKDNPIKSPLNEDNPIKFPLNKDIYLPEIYIHPITLKQLEGIKISSNYEYVQAKRAVINNNKMLNKINQYNRNIIGSNPYHEKQFPIIGYQPDLEEFSDTYVWEDEKIYYKTSVYEYIPYDSPDYYMSTSTNFGGVRIGNVSKVSGRKNVGWAALSRGDLYITERQLLIFDKGKKSTALKILNMALDTDTFNRHVFSLFLNEIEYVDGNTQEGALIITRTNNKMHKLMKANNEGKSIPFSENELRYLVNLIGSVIEKTFY